MLLLLASDKISLLYWMDRGGWVMWPLAFLGFVGLVVALERLWMFQRCGGSVAALTQGVRRSLLDGRDDEAMTACKNSTSSVGRVLTAVLAARTDGVGPTGLEKAAENSAIGEVSRLEKRLWILALITGMGPIIGFLGTVVGMIQSFEVIATQGMNNPGLVAEGISVALITTAGGLIVAVFVLPFYNFFTQRVGDIQHDMEMAASFVLQTVEEAPARVVERRKV